MTVRRNAVKRMMEMPSINNIGLPTNADMFIGCAHANDNWRSINLRVGPVLLSTPRMTRIWEGGPYSTPQRRVGTLAYPLPTRFCLRAELNTSDSPASGYQALLAVGGNAVPNPLRWPHHYEMAAPLMLWLKDGNLTFGVHKEYKGGAALQPELQEFLDFGG